MALTREFKETIKARMLELVQIEAPRLSLPYNHLVMFTLLGADDGRHARVPDFSERQNSRRPSQKARRSGVWHGGDSDR